MESRLSTRGMLLTDRRQGSRRSSREWRKEVALGRLKSLTILLTLGTWGAVTEGAPPQDAAPPATARQAPPVAPVKYLKAAQSLAKKNDPLAGQYARAADDYRDMLTAEERAQLDTLKAQLSPTPPTDPAVAPASTAGPAPVEAPPSF